MTLYLDDSLSEDELREAAATQRAQPGDVFTVEYNDAWWAEAERMRVAFDNGEITETELDEYLTG